MRRVDRFATRQLEEALATFRVAVLVGPRQSGKTTLARAFARGAPFLSLDDAATLAAMRAESAAFVCGVAPTGSWRLPAPCSKAEPPTIEADRAWSRQRQSQLDKWWAGLPDGIDVAK